MLKIISKATRRAKFFEMTSRLSLFALTQGVHLVPFKFHPTGLAINLAIVKDGQLTFN